MRNTESKRLAFGLASFAFVERFLRQWRNKLNPPAPPGAYLLNVNPTVKCRVAILSGESRLPPAPSISLAPHVSERTVPFTAR